MYGRRQVRYVGPHKHPKSFSLASEADMYLDNVLRKSGFARRPNKPLENFKTYWKSMNRKFKQDADNNPRTLF